MVFIFHLRRESDTSARPKGWHSGQGSSTCGMLRRPTRQQGLTAACRFRNLDSSVPMMYPAKDWMRNDVSEPLDRACAGRVLSRAKHAFASHGIFRNDSPKVLRGGSRMLIARTLALNVPPNALSLSRCDNWARVPRNASVIW